MGKNPKSLCPKYWSDATHVNMGCLLYNATAAMTWSEAHNFCHSENSHLVEIFSQEQQDYAVMKAFESELLTGSPRSWWIGMTDANSEGRWYWIYSGFDYTWTDEFQTGAYHTGGFPICQFNP